ncbi:MAG: HEAT repeat domain-containing protein [Anaerolineae bacterium]
MKLAVDFGTTNTVIAALDETGTRMVQIPGLSGITDRQPLVPSLVYVCNGQSGEVIVGQAVRDQGFDGKPDHRLFRNFKRGIVTLPTPDPRLIDGRQWGDREAGETFLRALLTALPRKQVEQMVITAPVAAFESYLAWLSGVMGELASDRVYIVDESTAAALGYAVTEPGAAVLVFDFGGGTLDLSLVQLPESRDSTGGLLRFMRGNATPNIARVIAKAGRVIGGSDIDQWLLGWALERLHLTPADVGSGYAALLTQCEQAKIRLSTETETHLNVEANGQAHPLTITRGDLETLLAANGFYDAIRHIIDKVMHVSHRSGIFKEDVKSVLLVGGVSLMPSVQTTLKAYFGDSAVRADKPFTAVAEGGLQVAAGFGLDDYLNQSYGLRYLDAKTGEARYDEVIPMGSRYPTEKAVEVELGAAHDGQTAVEFVVGEIDVEAGTMIEVRYEGGETVFVAQADTTNAQITPLNAASPLQVPLIPAANVGEARLQARFTVDTDRRLRVSVFDLNTRRELVTNAILATLGKTSAEKTSPLYGTSGYEPQIVHSKGKRERRLSLRHVAGLLKALPADSISLEATEAALRSESFGARHNAAAALRSRGDRAAREVIQRVLMDGSAPARAMAARSLNSFTWYAAEPLFRLALADTDPRVREGAMYALSDFRELKAYQCMAAALQAEADSVCEAAAVGLRDCQDPAVVPVLQAALKASDPDVRVKTLEALSNNDTPQALPVVRAALGDPDPDVLYAAVLSLLELAHENALEELAALIGTTSGPLRAAVLQAFFHATNYLNIRPAAHTTFHAILSAVETALRDPLPAVRMAACWPLVWMRDERANDLLWKLYREETDSGVKAHLVRVAVSLMSAIGEDLLKDALQSTDEQVRQAAELIRENRERTGIVLTYDESARPGTGFRKASRGR